MPILCVVLRLVGSVDKDIEKPSLHTQLSHIRISLPFKFICSVSSSFVCQALGGGAVDKDTEILKHNSCFQGG